jgi:plasmid stability protein
MATLFVKDVPDAVYAALQARARANGRSLSGEVRQILAAAAMTPGSRLDVVRRIEERRQKLLREGRAMKLEDIVQSIREDRER